MGSGETDVFPSASQRRYKVNDPVVPTEYPVSDTELECSTAFGTFCASPAVGAENGWYSECVTGRISLTGHLWRSDHIISGYAGKRVSHPYAFSIRQRSYLVSFEEFLK